MQLNMHEAEHEVAFIITSDRSGSFVFSCGKVVLIGSIIDLIGSEIPAEC